MAPACQKSTSWPASSWWTTGSVVWRSGSPTAAFRQPAASEEAVNPGILPRFTCFGYASSGTSALSAVDVEQNARNGRKLRKGRMLRHAESVSARPQSPALDGCGAGFGAWRLRMSRSKLALIRSFRCFRSFLHSVAVKEKNARNGRKRRKGRMLRRAEHVSRDPKGLPLFGAGPACVCGGWPRLGAIRQSSVPSVRSAANLRLRGLLDRSPRYRRSCFPARCSSWSAR